MVSFILINRFTKIKQRKNIGRYPRLFIDWGAKEATGIDPLEEMLKICSDKFEGSFIPLKIGKF